MCFATAALVAGGIGAGVSGIGALEGGAAASNAANYQAAVATNNATIASQNAQYAIAAGSRTAADTSLKGAAVGGKIKASQAASGIDVNTGSAVNVQQSEREKSKLDTETVLNNAQLQAYGYRSQSTGFQAQAGLDTLQGQQAQEGADIGATGSILSSASSLGFKWNSLGNSSGGNASPFTGTGTSPY